MKKIIFLCSVLHLSLLPALRSQESIINNVDDILLGKYITLAQQFYPLKKAADANVDKSRAQLSMATMSVLDIFNAGYFYSPQKNEGLIYLPGGASGTANVVMQGFQFGVNVNLGNLLSKPGQIKSAKADYRIAEAQRQDFNNNLASTVKARYYEYLSAQKQLELKSLAAKDMKSILNNAQTQFQNGTITIEVYTTAKSASITADAESLDAEVEYLKAKNALEDMIGTKLESVK
ncbi:hypothetical protein GCM10027051_28190 [Niabella terrae]